MKTIIKLIVVFILISKCSFSQNNDSLLRVYNNTSLCDSTRLTALNDVAWNLSSNNPDSSIAVSQMVIKFATDSVKNPDKWIAKTSNTMGVSYMNKGNYTKSLECYLRALKINERIGNLKSAGSCYGNIGILYKIQGDNAKALEYYFKSLKISEDTDDESGVGYSCGNIGVVLENQNKFEEALVYYFKALKICEKFGDKLGQSYTYSNIGAVYGKQGNTDKELEYTLISLNISKEIGDKQSVMVIYSNIGALYNRIGNYKKAILYSDSCLMSSNIGLIDGIMASYENLALAYQKTGNYKKAYESHVMFKKLTDSIFNANNSKELGNIKTQFEVEKKEAELKLKSEAEQERLKMVALEEKKRQQVIISSIVGILIVVIIFSLFLFSRFRITKRQKEVIEQQKSLVDSAYKSLHEKNKEVMDSINYAKRIQNSLLPSEKYIERNMNRLMTKTDNC